MINNMILALLTGLLLYFIIKYFKLKKDIKDFKETFQKKSKYGSISKMKNYNNKDLEDIATDFQKLIEKNNALKNERNKILNEYRELMANLSHDLRTPLTSVLGYLSLIKNEEDLEKIKKYIEISENKSIYLNDLIEKFYELSLIINSDKEIEKDYIDLKELVYSIAFEYYDTFIEKEQDMNIISVDENIEVFTSPKLLSTIMHNILDNMVKYSMGENSIEIKKDGNIKIIFSNNIEEKDGNYTFLFERSKVLDKSRKSSTGIGLSIVDASLDKLGYDRNIYIKDKKFYLEIEIPMN